MERIEKKEGTNTEGPTSLWSDAGILLYSRPSFRLWIGTRTSIPPWYSFRFQCGLKLERQGRADTKAWTLYSQDHDKWVAYSIGVLALAQFIAGSWGWICSKHLSQLGRWEMLSITVYQSASKKTSSTRIIEQLLILTVPRFPPLRKTLSDRRATVALCWNAS